MGFTQSLGISEVLSYQSNLVPWQRSANKDASFIQTLDFLKLSHIFKLRVNPINMVNPQDNLVIGAKCHLDKKIGIKSKLYGKFSDSSEFLASHLRFIVNINNGYSDMFHSVTFLTVQ